MEAVVCSELLLKVRCACACVYVITSSHIIAHHHTSCIHHHTSSYFIHHHHMFTHYHPPNHPLTSLRFCYHTTHLPTLFLPIQPTPLTPPTSNSTRSYPPTGSLSQVWGGPAGLPDGVGGRQGQGQRRGGEDEQSDLQPTGRGADATVALCSLRLCNEAMELG